MRDALVEKGHEAATDVSVGELERRTSIIYGKVQRERARQLAADLKLPSSLLKNENDAETVTLVLGKD